MKTEGSSHQLPIVENIATIFLVTKEESVQAIKKIIYKHLPKDKYNTFIFGSRAGSSARAWSDFDIGIKGEEKVPLSTIGLIKEDLENSRIPYKVDIVDFCRVPQKFRTVAQKKTIEL